MAEIIQSLWIGDALGPLQELSIASFLHFGHEYHLHCSKTVDNVPPGHLWHEIWRRAGIGRRATVPPTSYLVRLQRTYHGEGTSRVAHPT
jgi:hypothetical protein